MSERPTFVSRYDKKTYEYATEEELLEFANKLRELGGANPLEALMPSTPGNDSKCLIATSLNFGCEVNQLGEDGGFWRMDFPESMWGSEVERIAKAMGCKVKYLRYVNDDYVAEAYGMLLPEHIGNAAHAFDEYQGWTLKYNNNFAWKGNK